MTSVGSAMSTRTAKATGDKFLSCSNFPSCRNTKNVTEILA